MIRQRSLLGNSLSSLIASGVVILISLATPAILSRTLTRADYTIYAGAIALMPLIMILPQSLRNAAGTAIVGAGRTIPGSQVIAAYRLIVGLTFALLMAAAIVAICAIPYLTADHSPVHRGLLQLALIAVLANAMGIGCALLTTGPFTALQDFIPENLLKTVPPAIQLVLTAIVYFNRSDAALSWVLVALAVSPWPLGLWLNAKYWRLLSARFEAEALAPPTETSMREGQRQALRSLTASTLPILWWNLTAYLATTATTTIVALFSSKDIVSFGMAFSLIGLMSGGLVAISSPVASRISVIQLEAIEERMAAFRKFSLIFVSYIWIMTLAMIATPSAAYRLWVGSAYAEEVRTIMLLLIPATFMRLHTMCFTLFVMAVGRQSTLWLSPLIEAAIASIGSLLLIGPFGIMGVATALALASAIRLVLTFTHDLAANRDLLPITFKDIMFPVSGWKQ